MTKMFKREYLIEELGLPYTAIEDAVLDQYRWETVHQIVFQDKDGSYWMTSVLLGSTELQPTVPWEYEKEVECWPAEKKIVQREQWVPIYDEGGNQDGR